MKRHPTTTLAAVLFILLTAASVSAQPGATRVEPPPPPPPPGSVPAQLSIDPGRIEGGRYSNDFFGISFNIPKGWVAQDMAARQAIMQTGKQMVEEGTSDRKKAMLDTALSRTAFLLSVTKYEPGTPSPNFNAQLSCIAERVPTAVVKTGADYINAMTRMTQGTGVRLELTGPIRTETVGGVPFAVADAKLSTGIGVAAQKYYVMLSKGYAVMLGFTYADEADAKTFDDVLRSVSFK